MVDKKINVSATKFLRKNMLAQDVENLTKKFLKFLMNYKSIDNIFKYHPVYLKKTLKGKTKILNIDLFHVAEFDPYLYLKITEYPTEILSIFDFTICCIVFNKKDKTNNLFKKKIRTTFFNSKRNSLNKISSFNAKNLNKLITVRGIVSKYTENCVVMTSSFFRCEFCSFETFSFVESGKLIEPFYCYLCKNFHSFKILNERSHFNDKQFIQIENSIDEFGETLFIPDITIIAYDQAANRVKIGDFIEAIGILRISSASLSSLNYSDSFFDFFLDSIDIKVGELKVSRDQEIHKIKKLKGDLVESFKSDDMIKLNSLCQNYFIYNNIEDSFCPLSRGLNTVKQGLVSQIMINFDELSSINFEPFYKSLNILLIGNEKAGKEKLIDFIPKIIKKDIFLNEHKLKKEGDYSNFFIENTFYSEKKIFCIKNLQNIKKTNLDFIEEIVKKKRYSVANGKYLQFSYTRIFITGSINSIEIQKNKSKDYYSIKDFFLKNWLGFNFIYHINDILEVYWDKNMAKFFIDSLKKLRKNDCLYTPYNGLGFKNKSLFFFLNYFKRKKNLKSSNFKLKQVIKWKTIAHLIQNLKFSILHQEENAIIEFISKIAKSLSILRFSNIIGLSETKKAVVILFESLKSFRLFVYLNKIIEIP